MKCKSKFELQVFFAEFHEDFKKININRFYPSKVKKRTKSVYILYLSRRH